MLSRRLVAISLSLAALFAVPGCGQAEGQVCQIDGDCAGGLRCLCKLGGGFDSRGICHPLGFTACMTVTVDAFVPPEASTNDAGTDAFTPADMGADMGLDMGLDANVDASFDVGPDSPG